MKSPQKLLIFVILFSQSAISQIPCPTPPCVVTGPGLPIDSGLSFLIAAGAIYGYNKIRSKK